MGWKALAVGLVLLGLATVGNVAYALTPSSADAICTEERLKLIEKNLVIAMESDAPSLQTSAAVVLRQVMALTPGFEFSQSVIPLMRILKDDRLDSQARVAAALALNDLRSSIGDFAILRTAQFTEEQRLKTVCTWLVYERYRESNEAALSAHSIAGN